MVINPGIFKDYDIRARIPDELDMEGVGRIAEAAVFNFKPSDVAIGYDARTTSKQISAILTEVFISAGIDVIDLGMVSTDMVYFASGKHNYDLSIMVTASHNPAQYNGFKMTTKGGVAVSGPSGFYQIRDLALSDKKFTFNKSKKGGLEHKDIFKDWIDYCLSFVKRENIEKMKVVIDAGNGVGGKLFGHKYLVDNLPIEIVPLYFKPDGTFPNHIPNPLKSECLIGLREKIEETGADFGVALDGDGDRISFLTPEGKFISGTVITAILARELLKKNPGQTILYNAVCGRVAPEVIKSAGGIPKRVRVGHSLIKTDMRKENALFAGEHSCHYFYRDIYFAESSLVTFLLIAEFFSKQNQPISKVIERLDKYPQSGEINFEVKDKMSVMKAIEKNYQNKAKSIDWLDGISIWLDNWWANIRASNTQPLLRLNVEADTEEILNQKTKELISLIESLGGSQSKD